MKKSYLLLTLIIISLLGITHISAQPAMHHPEGPGRPGFDGPANMGPDGPRPPMGHGGRPDPEAKKQRQQYQTMMAIAEAHKELAKIYEVQDRYDDAIVELNKILQLFDSVETETEDKHQMQPALLKLLPIYHEIAKLYLKSDRFDEAEKFIIDSITKFEASQPQVAARMSLQLGEIYKRADKLDKAEEAYKRVIELNQKALANEK